MKKKYSHNRQYVIAKLYHTNTMTIWSVSTTLEKIDIDDDQLLYSCEILCEKWFIDPVEYRSSNEVRVQITNLWRSYVIGYLHRNRLWKTQWFSQNYKDLRTIVSIIISLVALTFSFISLFKK